MLAQCTCTCLQKKCTCRNIVKLTQELLFSMKFSMKSKVKIYEA